MRQVLVGDVGGTNARFALARTTMDGGITLHGIGIEPVGAHASFDDALATWIAKAGPIVSPKEADAVFAVAGPTGADSIRFTNSPWTVSRKESHERFGFRSVTLVNDFAAMARGALIQPDSEMESLLPGEALAGAPVVVLGPGTGLGLATLVPFGRDWRVLPGEGGHQRFAPGSAAEAEVLSVLMARHARVSFEDVVSGSGLERIYATMCTLQMVEPTLARAPQIGNAAIAQSDPIALAATEMLVSMLATFAQNAVLATGARGGVVLAGGVAGAIAPVLRQPLFGERFRDGGPMSPFMAQVPVRLIKDRYAALEGAAFFAPATL